MGNCADGTMRTFYHMADVHLLFFYITFHTPETPNLAKQCIKSLPGYKVYIFTQCPGVQTDQVPYGMGLVSKEN